MRSIVDRAGAIVERYAYDGYGRPYIREAVGRGDMDNNSKMDDVDSERVKDAKNGTIWDPRADLDDDGDMDTDDQDLFDLKMPLWDPGDPFFVGPTVSQAFSDVDNRYAFQGVPHFVMDTAANATVGKLTLGHHRARLVDVMTGRWITRDPLKYDKTDCAPQVPSYSFLHLSNRVLGCAIFVSNINVYGNSDSVFEFLGTNPNQHRDPTGLQCDTHCEATWSTTYQSCMDAQIDPAMAPGCETLADGAYSACVGSLPPTSCAGRPLGSTDTSRCCYPPSYTYMGVSAACMCRCMGNDPWSKAVRACLQCYYNRGCAANNSHSLCYEAADQAGFDRPWMRLAFCVIYCL